MRTLEQLILTCPPTQFQKANQTYLYNAKAVKNRLTKQISVKATAQRVSEEGYHDKHQVEIEAVEADTLLTKGHVRVWCDCGFHSYYGQEYLLTQRDASTITYTDGSPPTTRNPHGRIMLCHHLLRLAIAVRSRGI